MSGWRAARDFSRPQCPRGGEGGEDGVCGGKRLIIAEAWQQVPGSARVSRAGEACPERSRRSARPNELSYARSIQIVRGFLFTF